MLIPDDLVCSEGEKELSITCIGIMGKSSER